MTLNITEIETLEPTLAKELPKVAVSSFDMKNHQAKIHNEVVKDLLKYFDKISQEQAKDIVRLFVMGKIRNLKINY
jgi:hypothetical protein